MSHAVLKRIPAGRELFVQGESVETLYWLERGVVKLLRWETGDRPIIVGVRLAGTLLGAAAGVAQRPHPVTAAAAGECDIVPISWQRFSAVMEDDADCRAAILRMLAQDVYEHISYTGHVGMLPVEIRLRRLLARFCAANPPMRESTGWRIPMRAHDIAQAVWSTREHVSRLLNRLECHGAIRRDRGAVVVTALARLQHPPQHRCRQ